MIGLCLGINDLFPWMNATALPPTYFILTYRYMYHTLDFPAIFLLYTVNETRILYTFNAH